MHFIPNNNGLFVMVVGFRCGAINEPKELAGISHVLEHVMFKNTTTKRSMHLIHTLTRLGAKWNATTYNDYTVYYVCSSIENAQEVTQTLIDVVGALDVSDSEFQKGKFVVMEELALHPSEPAFMNVFKLAHLGTPYSSSVIGSKKTLEAMSLGDVKQFHEAHYKRPIIIYSCGTKYKTRVEEWLSDYNINNVQPPCNRLVDINEGRILGRDNRILTKTSAGQSESCQLAYLGFPMSDPRAQVANLIAYILSHRMFLEVREQNSLVYSIKIEHDTRAHVGCFIVRFKTRRGQVVNVLRAFKRHVADLAKMDHRTYRSFYSSWTKTLLVNSKVNPFYTALNAVKRELYCADANANTKIIRDPTLLTTLFDPRRLGYIIRTKTGSRKEIDKILKIVE